MKLLGITLWIMGTLLLLAQAQDLQQERKVIYLAEVSCKIFTELTQQEQGIITAWLQGYHLPEHEPAVIDFDKLLSDRGEAYRTLHEPGDDVMTAAEAVMEK